MGRVPQAGGVAHNKNINPGRDGAQTERNLEGNVSATTAAQARVPAPWRRAAAQRAGLGSEVEPPSQNFHGRRRAGQLKLDLQWWAWLRRKAAESFAIPGFGHASGARYAGRHGRSATMSTTAGAASFELRSDWEWWGAGGLKRVAAAEDGRAPHGRSAAMSTNQTSILAVHILGGLLFKITRFPPLPQRENSPFLRPLGRGGPPVNRVSRLHTLFPDFD